MSLSRIRPTLQLLRPSAPILRLSNRPNGLRSLPAFRSLHHTSLRPTTLSALRAVPVLNLRRAFSSTPQLALDISPETKAYLKEQGTIAFQLVFYGYAFCFLLAWIAWGTIEIYLEQERATPEVFDFWTRSWIRNARCNADWSLNFVTAAKYMQDAVVDELKKRDTGKVTETEGWRVGMSGMAWEWLEYETKAKDLRGMKRALDTLLGFGWVKGGERSRALVKLASTYEEMGEEDDTVSAELEKAVITAGQDVNKPETAYPKDAKLAVIASGERVTQDMLDASTELAIFHARRKNLSTALPIFLSVLRARESQPDFSDPCEEGKIMSYIAEMLFAGGRQKEGIQWNQKVLDLTMPRAEERKKCKDCAVYAGRNMVLMWEAVKEEAKAKEAGRALMRMEAVRVSRYD